MDIKRIWAEIDLDNLVYNLGQAKVSGGDRGLFCVIKANAYGHGIIPVARALAEAGATHFAVATADEALQLRRHGFGQYILIMGIVGADDIPALDGEGIAVAVNSLGAATAFSLSAKNLPVHIKLETGMKRLGMDIEDAVEEIAAITRLPHLRADGLFTHFSAADMPEEGDFTRRQMDMFSEVCTALAARGVDIPIKHCSNSAATIGHSYTHLDMLRPGIMLYGYNPIPGHDLPLKPVLSLRARVSQVLRVRRGESVGYGRAWYAPHDAEIATISAGYADGLLRGLSGKMPAIVNGSRVTQVGRICMDMSMLDVTGLGVQPGDYATLMGSDGSHSIWADEVAELAGTIPYEITCAVGLRVPRAYISNGKVTSEDNYLDLL